MNKRKLVALTVLFCFAFLFISCSTSVSAQTDDWEIPDDWDTGSGFSTPSPSPNSTQQQYSNFVASIFVAIGIFSLLPIILAVFVFSKGQIDQKTVIMILAAIMIMVVAMLILFSFIGAANNAMGV